MIFEDERIEEGDLVRTDDDPAYGSYAGQVAMVIRVKGQGRNRILTCFFPNGAPYKLRLRAIDWLTKVS